MSDVQTTPIPSGDAAPNHPNRVNEGVLPHFGTIWTVLHPVQLSQPLKGTATGGQEEEFSSSLGNNEDGKVHFNGAVVAKVSSRVLTAQPLQSAPSQRILQSTAELILRGMKKKRKQS